MLINELAKTLKKHYQRKVDLSKKALAEDRRNASGRLSASIRPVDTIVSQTVVELDLVGEDYWKFIDKGVKGWANEKAPQDSPFQFKKRRIPVSVLTGAGGWIANKGLVTAGSNAKTENAALGRVFSASIARKGIRATAFISDVFNTKQVAELKQEIKETHIRVTTKQIKDGNNN